jgi:cell division protein FtsQ
MARIKRKQSILSGFHWHRMKRRVFFGAVLMLLFLFLGLWYAYRQEIENTRIAFYNQFMTMTQKHGLKLNNVFIRGRNHVSKDQVFQSLGIPMHGPMLQIDLEQVHQRLLSLPWVKSVALERHWPDTLFITMTERQPFALWQHQRKIHLVDKDGVIILEKNLKPFMNLPSITGENAPKHLPKLLMALAQFPLLKKRIVSATWIGNRRWNLHLDNKITLLLPEKDIQKALVRFIKYETTHQLTTSAKQRIDLRIPQRIIVE